MIPGSFVTPHCNFSHARTYAIAIKMKTIVAAIKIRSNIAFASVEVVPQLEIEKVVSLAQITIAD